MHIMEKILTTILFKKNSLDLPEIEFINPDEFENAKHQRNKDPKVRQTCYTLVLSLINGSIENFEILLSLNLLSLNADESKDEKKTQFSRMALSNAPKCEGHLGLRNLGCICYMNSMLQQFYMVPTLRYGVLQVNDKVPIQRDNALNVDDSMFHQVQRMFTFLDLSQREDYVPHGFCYSFKDYEVYS